MIHLDLQPEIEAQLAAEAQSRGVALDRYVEEIVTAKALEHAVSNSPAEAVAAIRELRKGIRLDGLKISDLVQEGRRY
jgi:hypothetical protein